jgi:NADPH-dependent 2,4-dienoyl-CoA reductase/sulfur reductase-like enzyme
MYYDVVVLGGGVGGGEASLRLARLYKSTALISAYPVVYSRMTLSYGLKRDVKSIEPYVIYTPKDLRDRGVTFIHGKAVLVEPDRNTVILESGDKIEYGTLVVATGSKPKMPAVEGANLKGIFTFQTFDDMLELGSVAEPGRRALVVGTGMIGLLVSDALASRGVKVYSIDILNYPGLTAVEEPLSKVILNAMKLKGVEFIGGVTVERLSGNGRVESAILTNGEKLPVDFVVFSIGVFPNIPQGLEVLNRDYSGALLTDSLLRTSGYEIYAIGDCATTLDLQTGKSVYRPLGIIASYAAKTLPRVVEGLGYQGFLAYQIEEAFNLTFMRVGLNGFESRGLGIAYSLALVELKVPGLGIVRDLVLYERGSSRLIGWQSVSKHMASYKSKVFESMIKDRRSVEELQEKGFKVIELPS